MSAVIDRRYRRKTSLLQGKADFQRHLPVGDISLFEITARFSDLEPAHVAHRLAGTRQRILDRIFDSIRRRANQLDLFVNMITHGSILRRSDAKTNNL